MLKYSCLYCYFHGMWCIWGSYYWTSLILSKRILFFSVLVLYFAQAFNLMDFLGVSQHLRPLLPLYNILLRSCVESKSIIQASKCLELMEKQMVGKNEATYSELLKVIDSACIILLVLLKKNIFYLIKALSAFRFWSYNISHTKSESTLMCVDVIRCEFLITRSIC